VLAAVIPSNTRSHFLKKAVLTKLVQEHKGLQKSIEGNDNLDEKDPLE
jgi:hypothetical protein